MLLTSQKSNSYLFIFLFFFLSSAYYTLDTRSNRPFVSPPTRSRPSLTARAQRESERTTDARRQKQQQAASSISKGSHAFEASRASPAQGLAACQPLRRRRWSLGALLQRRSGVHGDKKAIVVRLRWVLVSFECRRRRSVFLLQLFFSETGVSRATGDLFCSLSLDSCICAPRLHESQKDEKRELENVDSESICRPP